MTAPKRFLPRWLAAQACLLLCLLPGLSPAAPDDIPGPASNISDPQVTVRLLPGRSRQVAVLGQVSRPGRYVLDGTRTTLTDILALAGGVTPAGDDSVTVVRACDGKNEKFDINVPKMYRTGNMGENIELDHGDTVFVRRAQVFYIYGEVQKAGTYRLENDLTIMQALSLGGGMTPRGTERGIRVARRAVDGSLVKREAELADLVQPDDIILVRESLF